MTNSRTHSGYPHPPPLYQGPSRAQAGPRLGHLHSREPHLAGGGPAGGGAGNG